MRKFQELLETFKQLITSHELCVNFTGRDHNHTQSADTYQQTSAGRRVPADVYQQTCTSRRLPADVYWQMSTSRHVPADVFY